MLRKTLRWFGDYIIQYRWIQLVFYGVMITVIFFNAVTTPVAWLAAFQFITVGFMFGILLHSAAIPGLFRGMEEANRDTVRAQIEKEMSAAIAEIKKKNPDLNIEISPMATVIDKTAWGPGPWQDEPDSCDWRDERTGLHCAIRRNMRWGQLNGYVGVPVGHPFYGWNYHDKICSRPEDYEGTLDDVDIFAAFLHAIGDNQRNGTIELGMALKVHQGITWSGEGPQANMDSGLWWFGFDCGHAWDVSPGLRAILPPDIMEIIDRPPRLETAYRTVEYVKQECTSLAFQLRQLEGRVIKTEMPEALKSR